MAEIHYFSEEGQRLNVTHEMRLGLGLVALFVTDPDNPRKLAPDMHWEPKEGHFVSQAQNGPAKQY